MTDMDGYDSVSGIEPFETTGSAGSHRREPLSVDIPKPKSRTKAQVGQPRVGQPHVGRAKADAKKRKAPGVATRVRASARPDAAVGDHPIIGSSPAVKSLRERIALYAPHDENVLVVGETGSGKEAVARGLHRASSRADRPLIVHNAGRVDHELTGSEYFGHRKGAFTGAVDDREGLFTRADEGVLHLDEIAELPLDLQANLLRTLEDGFVTPVGATRAHQVDVRVVAATNRDLFELVEAGRFREDLFYRLNGLTIDVPPLRARGDDVVEIAEHFLARSAEKSGVHKRLDARAADRLKEHDWPGNIRELRTTISRAVIHAPGLDIDEDHILLDQRRRSGRLGAQIDYKAVKELAGQFVVLSAVEEAKEIKEAAARVNLSRTVMHESLKKIREEGATKASLEKALRAALGLQ